MVAIKATEVFVPGSYPRYTYVERSGEQLESALRDAIETPGQIVSLAGPSKSGKTVLVEKVIGRDQLIPLSGASIRHPDEVWERIFDWMEVPNSVATSTAFGATAGLEGSATAKASLPLIGSGEGTVGASSEVRGDSSTEATRERYGLGQVVREIGDSDFVVLVDDFHYMNRDVQEQVAKNLKEAVRLGVKIVTAAVRHRGDDVVRANPELRGRVRSIDLGYWKPEELNEIAQRGFERLNAKVPQGVIDTFINESAGSPQLMQLLCLQACFALDYRTKTLLEQGGDVSGAQLRSILEQASANTDFRSLVDVLDAGPKTRGTERKTYQFTDGTRGDVYRCVLKAVASDPPSLSLPYDKLLERTVKVCSGESPVGSSVTGTCLHISKLAQEKFPNERAIDWDEQKQILDIPDPYLLFFLRWSDRLREDDERA